MAEPVYAKIKINGQDIKGESTVTSLERADTIECTRLWWAVETPREGASAQITGRRLFRPLTITKRVDKSSPVLFKALCRNEKVDDALFMFFRANPTGNGEEQKYMTIELVDGYVTSLETVSEDATRSHSEQPTAMEDVKFVFKKITVTYTDGGITHTDSWSGE
jgi:type VI secretion system secreted protein Hcp